MAMLAAARGRVDRDTGAVGQAAIIAAGTGDLAEHERHECLRAVVDGARADRSRQVDQWRVMRSTADALMIGAGGRPAALRGNPRSAVVVADRAQAAAVAEGDHVAHE